MATPLLILSILLFQSSISLSIRSKSNHLSLSHSKNPAPLIFPLKTQVIPPSSLPSSPNKLRFHHNVTLTVSLSIGTPPQNATVVLDTGSELSWLRCTSSSPLSFNPHASSSFSSIPCSSQTCVSKARDLPVPATCEQSSHLCHVALSYSDASTSEGSLSSDLFRLGDMTTSPSPIRTTFGCMTSTFDSAVDPTATTGLLGMNRGALSFVTQAATRRFSYCISDRDSSGVLLIGSTNLPFMLPLNYTPFVQISLPLPYFDRVAYSVQLDGIRVGSTQLPILKSLLLPDHTGAGQTMVDSGTQFTFLLGDPYNILKTEFLRQTKGILTPLNEPDYVFQGAFDLCFRVPEGKSVPGYIPSVALVFKGAEMVVVGERLLYKVPGEKRGGDGIWCFTFGNSDLVPISAYVIGHHHQQNVWVEYDLENGRVGFAPIKCDVASQKLGLML
ncbi:aspartic proteinase PCS1-like protein [Carex littledalei]|uniref:Aspartic proteinase PCS1-like protein n=1 Tax=Carex littledalei TaxID=544730 RepID=A0A833VDN2_9POAL|nr:aspartic proteinase PCS1-like protein [Carex littledalei]